MRAINHMRRPDVPTFIITFIQVLQSLGVGVGGIECLPFN